MLGAGGPGTGNICAGARRRTRYAVRERLGALTTKNGQGAMTDFHLATRLGCKSPGLPAVLRKRRRTVVLTLISSKYGYFRSAASSLLQ